MNPSSHAQSALGAWMDSLTALADDGWQRRTAINQPNIRTRLISPNQLLHMDVEQNTTSGHVYTHLGILPSGTGEPARWHAHADNPPPALWRKAAGSAARAHDEPRQPGSFHPGVTLERLGWTSRDVVSTVWPAIEYTSKDTKRHLVHHPPASHGPALWTIIRPETWIQVTVTFAEPHALPLLVLMLTLSGPDGTILSP